MSLLFHKQVEDGSSLSDEELLALSVRQPALFKLIVERYEAAFGRKVRSIIGNREEVADILQETFTRIYFNAAKFTPQEGATFASWAYRIVQNVSFTYYQKLKRRGGVQVNLETEMLEALPEVARDEQEVRLTEEFVVSILVRMPAMLGQVLRLHFLDDMSHKEIGERLGLSITAVKARVHRAKKEFRKVKEELESRQLFGRPTSQNRARTSDVLDSVAQNWARTPGVSMQTV